VRAADVRGDKPAVAAEALIRGRRRAFCVAALACAASGLARSAQAQSDAATNPDRPVRLVVAYPPGGIVDHFARVVQAPLAEALGQGVVIENRPGASGTIGAELVARAAPDGHTLLIGNTGILAINPGIFAKLAYDAERDFTPIVRGADAHYMLAVHPSVPAATVAEFVAYAKAHPGKLAYGSAGSGSLIRLATELFMRRTGIEMIHVPYKGGAPLAADLVAGVVQVALADQTNLLPLAASGRLRAIAVASPARSPIAPELPTIAETLPGFEVVAWHGILGPTNLPQDTVARINVAFNRAMSRHEVRAKLVAAGLATGGGTADEFARFVRAEREKWSAIAKTVGAKAD
jgi:tripartite-type tricarboxylate transporter receptor subunit TctC